MTIQEAIAAVIDRQDLSAEDAEAVMTLLMQGEGTPSQVAGFLVALRMKGESVGEITGFARAMRSLSTKIRATRSPLVDTCGTGGSGLDAFNISTTAAFVVAGAGVAVAKHGNRAASSKSGSADVLEALGVNIDASPELVGRCIDELGIGFLFARALHGAMKHVAPTRMELKTRTVFNLLGPLTNPAGADGQVIGVFDKNRLGDLAYVLANLGTRRAFVVAGSDGLDEITLTGPTHVAEAIDGQVKTYDVSPETFGVKEAPLDAIQGGDAAENAAILRSVLDGEPGPRRDIVLVNAAVAIGAGEGASDWNEAMEKARASVDGGAARAKLEQLITLSQEGSE